MQSYNARISPADLPHRHRQQDMMTTAMPITTRLVLFPLALLGLIQLITFFHPMHAPSSGMRSLNTFAKRQVSPNPAATCACAPVEGGASGVTPQVPAAPIVTPAGGITHPDETGSGVAGGMNGQAVPGGSQQGASGPGNGEGRVGGPGANGGGSNGDNLALNGQPLEQQPVPSTDEAIATPTSQQAQAVPGPSDGTGEGFTTVHVTSVILSTEANAAPTSTDQSGGPTDSVLPTVTSTLASEEAVSTDGNAPPAAQESPSVPRITNTGGSDGDVVNESTGSGEWPKEEPEKLFTAVILESGLSVVPDLQLAPGYISNKKNAEQVAVPQFAKFEPLGDTYPEITVAFKRVNSLISPSKEDYLQVSGTC